MQSRFKVFINHRLVAGLCVTSVFALCGAAYGANWTIIDSGKTPSGQGKPPASSQAAPSNRPNAAEIKRLNIETTRLHKQGDYVKVIELASKVLQLDPDNASAYLNRCAAYPYLHKIHLGIADCDKAIALKPDYAEAFAWRAFAKLGINQLISAIEDATTAATLKSGLTFPYLVRCEAYLKLKEYTQAERDALEAVRIEPNNAWAQLILGDVLLFKENYREAIVSYEKSNNNNFPYLRALYGLAQAHYALGDREAALIYMRKAVKLSPSNKSYKERLVQMEQDSASIKSESDSPSTITGGDQGQASNKYPWEP